MLTFTNSQWVPPGGYQYIQPESGMAFKENYWANLVQKVHAHRLANNYPLGANWQQQLVDANCTRNPEWCHETATETLAGRAINFATAMIRWAKQGFPVVAFEEYHRRLTICENCPEFRGTADNYAARCGRCGCSIIKLNMATEKCPLSPPKW